jgi:hypothetical protein
MNYYLTITIALFSMLCFAQQPASDWKDDDNRILQKKKIKQSSLVKNLPFISIGLSIMSGRVTSLAVNTENPVEFYVGYASGGVWHIIIMESLLIL